MCMYDGELGKQKWKATSSARQKDFNLDASGHNDSRGDSVIRPQEPGARPGRSAVDAGRSDAVLEAMAMSLEVYTGIFHTDLSRLLFLGRLLLSKLRVSLSL